MRSLRLILVRWRGDVIGAYTERAGDVGGPATRLAACEGVALEIHEVSGGRGPFAARRLLDGDVAVGVALALALHFLAGMALLGASLHWGTPSPEQQDEERAATIRDTLTRIAANDGVQSRDEHRDVPADDDSRHTPDTPVAQAAAATETPRPAPRPVSTAAASGPRASSRSAAQGSGGTSDVSTSPAVCAAPRSSATGAAMCTRSVVVASLTRESGCFVDTVVSEGQRGTLTYACDGDGPATAVFGAHSFTGVVHDGGLDACTGTEYPWSDGCRWTSAQHLSGSVSGGTLAFAYGEAPKAGPHPTCLPACWARGTITVER
jgi:hypothetical protein